MTTPHQNFVVMSELIQDTKEYLPESLYLKLCNQLKICKDSSTTVESSITSQYYESMYDGFDYEEPSGGAFNILTSIIQSCVDNFLLP